MREILFRGKRVDNGEWIEGSAINTQYDVRGDKHIYIGILTKSEMYPLMQIITWFEVIPETVGQFTGLTDKNGTKIFEGDIILYDEEVGQIIYDDEDAEFILSFGTWVTDFGCISGRWVEVIGNIHDNP